MRSTSRQTSRRTLQQIEQELRRLERERDALDRSIARLRQAALWLRERARADRPASKGALAVPQSLTNVCRAALRTTGIGLTPTEVKQLLTSFGFDWEPFTNPMSAVHTVLKRLVKQDQASATVGNDGRRRFVWNRKPYVSAGAPTQAQEAARIEHLLDGSLSGEAVLEYLKRREKSSAPERLRGEGRTAHRPR